MALPQLDLSHLSAAYNPRKQAAGHHKLTPSELIRALYPKLAATHNVFIHLVPQSDLLERCKELEEQPHGQRGALWGVPFAVKDNVDVQGLPTTAGCPAFQYVAERSAPAIEALLRSGAIMVGKTNMDQFASGLVGTRSPYGVAACAFDCRFIPGGSSSGSGAIVGSGLVTFAIGTDTAGSGRVPAMFNGCVGMKPTVGSVSTHGAVPACASLDCLSVFCRSVHDGITVVRIMRGGDAGGADAFRRAPVPVHPPTSSAFRMAVPPAKFLDWSSPGGDLVAQQCGQQFEAAVKRLQQVGGTLVEIDFEPFTKVAAMLYEAAFVAERYSGIRSFLDAPTGGKAAASGEALQQQRALAADTRLLPVTRTIISGASKFTATDVYDDLARLAALRARANAELAKFDVLLVPTALAHYTVDELAREEGASQPKWSQNAKLGRFTNFVNLLDMCGIAVPSGLVTYDVAALARDAPAGGDVALRAQYLAAHGPATVTLPFGVTLLSKAWQDDWLAGIAQRMHELSGYGCGPEGHGVTPVLPGAAGAKN